MTSEKEKIEIILWEGLEEAYFGPQTSEAFVNRTWAALRRAGDRRMDSLTYLLRRFLDHENNDLRIQALSSLCLIGDPESIPLAVELVCSPLCDPSDRARSLEALIASKALDRSQKKTLIDTASEESSPKALKKAAMRCSSHLE